MLTERGYLFQRYYVKYMILSLVVFIPGCELLPSIRLDELISRPVSQTEQEQEMMLGLLYQANYYGKRLKTKSRVLCRTLKEDYQISGNWQSAWLLVFVINRDFKCLDIKTALTYLNNIQENQLTVWLQQLNKNQIKLLHQYLYQRKENAILQHQLQEKSEDLQKTTEQVQKMTEQIESLIAKIKALTTIETQINHKLNNE